jgi:ectoine hydroxylase
MTQSIDGKQLDRYRRDGFVIVRGLFAKDEAGLILDAALADERLRKAAYSRTDSEGNQTLMSVWDQLGDDIYSVAMRSRRVVDIMETLIGEEVCHYNSKLNAKEPKVGGRWEWHQDYGYAYGYGVLAPKMATCFIALDPSTRDNGCIELLAGSHRLGRLDHVFVGKQYCADPERVAAAEQRLEVVPCELEPGDTVFFHCNTLHRSSANRSDRRRWVLITVFNALSNLPYKQGPHAGFHPVEKVDDAMLRSCVGRVSDETKVFQAKAYNPAAA